MQFYNRFLFLKNKNPNYSYFFNYKIKKTFKGAKSES